MEWYDDVTITREKSRWHCEKFGLDEDTHELRFENVNPGMNLWKLPIQGTIGVEIRTEKGTGRFVFHGVQPGPPSSPPTPNEWRGTFTNHPERFGEAAKQGNT